MRFSVLPHKDNTFSPNSPTPHPKTHNTNNLQKPQKSTLFSIISPPHNQQHHNVGTCLRHVSLQSAMFQRITQHAEGMSLRYGVTVLRNLMRLFTKKPFYHQGFFAVKRRAVFILGAKWKALVRGWRRDCGGVLGGVGAFWARLFHLR